MVVIPKRFVLFLCKQAYYRVLMVQLYLPVVKPSVVVATLGTGRDAQVIESASGEKKESFMLHYNFPPYCVGEVGMSVAPSVVKLVMVI